MLTLLLLMACGPKAPPAGAIDITDQVAVSGAGPDAPLPAIAPLPPRGSPMPRLVGAPLPLPLGQALPWEGAPLEAAHVAFAEGEAVLAQMAGVERPDDPAGSRRAAAALAEMAESARTRFVTASADPALICPAQARWGDALRRAAEAAGAVGPPEGLDEATLAEWRGIAEGAAEALRGQALETYEQATSICDEDSPWGRHAAWGLRAVDPGRPL